MRHTIPWSIKGVDQDAREAAKDAARRAGMSLGEWLNAAIAEQAAEAARGEEMEDDGLTTVTRRLDSIAQKLDAVTRRDSQAAIPPSALARADQGEIVRALDAVARLAEISERRSAAAIEAVNRLRSPLPGAAQEPARQETAGRQEIAARQETAVRQEPAQQEPAQREPAAQPAAAHPGRRETQAQLDEIARSIRSLESAAPAAPPARSLRHDIDATVAEIAARQRALETAPKAVRPEAPAIEAARHDQPKPEPARPEAPAADISPLAGKLDALGRKLDSILSQAPARQEAPPPPPPPAADRALVTEISKLNRRIDAFQKPEDDRLEREIRGLSAGIEQMRRDLAAERAAQEAAKAAADKAARAAEEAGRQEKARDQQVIAGVRADIAALADHLVDLAPRRAVESLERDLQAVAGRLDEARAQGVPAEALERLVDEFERAVARMMPAEGIAEEIRTLATQVDSLAARGIDPAAIDRLADETRAVRAMLSDTVSHRAVEALADQIAALGRRIGELELPRPVENVAESVAEGVAGGIASLASALEARIDEMADRLERASQRPVTVQPAGNPELEHALRRLADKLEASHMRGDEAAALGELERHILDLAAKIDASDARFSQLGTIERGLSDLFVQMEAMRASAVEAAEQAARAAISRERDADARQSREQDAIEAVQATLERVVRRIAEIETPPLAPESLAAAPLVREPAKAPEPALSSSLSPAPAPSLAPAPMVKPAEIRRPEPAPLVAERPAAPVSRQAAPTVPPGSVDLPLEPGSGAPRLRPPAPGSAPAGGSRSDFIAAARRAAQAATTAEPAGAHADEAAEARPSLLSRLRGAGRRVREPKNAAPKAQPELILEPAPALLSPGLGEADEAPAKPRTNRRTIVMAIAAALLVLAAGLSTLPRLRGNATAEPPAPAAATAPRSETAPQSFVPASASSTPVQIAPRTVEAPPPEPPAAPAAAPLAAPATTGSLGAPPSGTTVSPTGWQPADTRTGRPISLPAALKSAAEAGNPAAAYEIGTRYLEGRGVMTSPAEAARWYQRAADGGVVLAQYRLGSLYEKGTGVTRDFARARTLYESAAQAGNGKAMHNLAVMFAQGQAAERPDYKAAADWFRRAAEHGVTDSQYNLGILYARGLGVDQSLAESYKWFALAANGGDQDAAKKRDEVATRLDAQTLVAARLAVQTFTPRPEPDNAVRVSAPPDGWGDAPAQSEAPAPQRPAGARARSASR